MQNGQCDWMTRHTTFWRWKRNTRNSENQKSPACIPGYGEEDSWKHFRCSLKGWKLCWAEWNHLNLQLKEWTRDHNAHITGHVYGGPVVRICRFTVHCFKCWACLPGRAAGFRGLHWQSYIRHTEEVSFCVLAGSALYHQALKSTLGWVFDVEICLKWRPQWELIGKVSRVPQMCM